MTDTEISLMLLLKRFNNKTLIPLPELFDVAILKSVKCPDFLNFPTEYKFKTVIGVVPCNKIDKCIDHIEANGEMIICTNSGFVNKKKLYTDGTLTDVLYRDDYHVILRFAKSDFSHQTLIDGKWYNYSIKDNHLYFALPS
jgi:hypothetical protein